MDFRRSQRRNNRCKRGSAILWVMMMVVSVAAVALVASELGMSSIRDTIRYGDEQEVQYAWEATCAKVDADGVAGTRSTYPATYTLSMNGATATVTVTDNTANMSNSILLTGTVTANDGRTFAESTILPKQHTPSIWDYALFLATAGPAGTHSITTGASGSNGDVFALGNQAFHAVSTVNGNIGATGTITGVTATGTISQSTIAPCSWPTPSDADYQGYATTTIATGNYTGYTFPTVSAGSSYPLVYCSGNLSIKGAISGIGTFYVAGTFNLSGVLTYADSSSRVAFITPNNFNLDQDCVGYYYCGGTATTQAKTMTGGLATSIANFAASPTLINDPSIKNSSNLGVLMHLPGLWSPTNLYAGSYSGTYTDGTDHATEVFTVSSTGVVSGTVNDAATGAGTLSGTLDNAGNWAVNEVYPSGTWSDVGALTLSGSTLSGSVVSTKGATHVTETMNITKQ